MVTVGMRELKQQASALIRRVREEGDEILVTYHGKVVARKDFTVVLPGSSCAATS